MRILRIPNRSVFALLFLFSLSSSFLYFIYVAPGLGECDNMFLFYLMLCIYFCFPAQLGGRDVWPSPAVKSRAQRLSSAWEIIFLTPFSPTRQKEQAVQLSFRKIKWMLSFKPFLPPNAVEHKYCMTWSPNRRDAQIKCFVWHDYFLIRLLVRNRINVSVPVLIVVSIRCPPWMSCGFSALGYFHPLSPPHHTHANIVFSNSICTKTNLACSSM